MQLQYSQWGRELVVVIVSSQLYLLIFFPPEIFLNIGSIFCFKQTLENHQHICDCFKIYCTIWVPSQALWLNLIHLVNDERLMKRGPPEGCSWVRQTRNRCWRTEAKATPSSLLASLMCLHRGIPGRRRTHQTLEMLKSPHHRPAPQTFIMYGDP